MIAATPLARRLMRVGYYSNVGDFMQDPEGYLEVEDFPETVQMFVECGDALGIPFWQEAKDCNHPLDRFIELCREKGVAIPHGWIEED